MTYDEAVAVVKEKAPGVVIISDGSQNHIALQKAEGDTPFCITLPDSKHLYAGRLEELAAAERESLVLSVQQYLDRP